MDCYWEIGNTFRAVWKVYLTCGAVKLVNVDRDYGKPDKPTVYNNFVVPAYRDRESLIQTSFYQATIHMKGVETVLNA
jgi:hypothetical protein